MNLLKDKKSQFDLAVIANAQYLSADQVEKSKGKQMICPINNHQKQIPIVEPKDTTNIVRTLVSLSKGGQVHLVDVNNLQVKGERTFKGNVIKGIISQVVDSIQVNYALKADGKASALDFTQDLPIILRNSFLVFEQNNRELFRMPISDLHNSGVASTTAENYYELDRPFTLIGETEFNLFIATPQDADVPVGDTYVEVMWKGLQG